MGWLYQLQACNKKFISAAPATFKVIDPFNDASVRWTVSDVQTMRGSAQTKMLAYLSIGEAEDYRDYWDKAWNEEKSRPSWLDRENPDWPGNFKVHYWAKDWQNIILREVGSIIDQGFDGVYLDIIDGYEYYEERYNRRDYALEMVNFVKTITTYARTRRPGFLIVPQNGEGLLERADYVKTISAIGKEDVFFGVDGDGHRNDPAYTRAVLDDLKPLTEVGKPVLLVEYGLGPRQREIVRQAAREHGFIPFFACRQLDVSCAPEPCA